MTKGYWKTVGAKILRVVDETFCSIPTDDTSCCYLDRLTFGASTTRCKPAKKNGSNDSVTATSSMIKSVKMMEKRKKGVRVVGIAYLSLVGSLFVLHSNFSLIIRKIIS